MKKWKTDIVINAKKMGVHDKEVVIEAIKRSRDPGWLIRNQKNYLEANDEGEHDEIKVVA